MRSISDYVVGLRFIDARANVVELSLERDADLPYAAQLSALYPQWNRFAELRNNFDRERIFANAHLRSVLGK